MTGPENGAADFSIWEPETARPLGGPPASLRVVPFAEGVYAGIISPPAAHAFFIPAEGLRDVSKWILDNCLLVTRAHYKELERTAAGLPLGVIEAERKRAGGAVTGVAASGGDRDTAAAPPSPALWPPDEWQMLARIEALEAAVKNQEAVIAMCVETVTRVVERFPSVGKLRT